VRWGPAFVGWQKWLEIADGGDKVAFLDRDGKVDGVEVRVAVKAASQVCTGIDCRDVFLTTGAQEGELSVTSLVWPSKLFEQEGPRDVVA
jgi:hypothetical protein